MCVGARMGAAGSIEIVHEAREPGMPFPSAAVGLDLDETRTSVSTRRVLAYAAGLGAADPCFMDDARPDGLLALPFQCVSSEWPALLSLREALAERLSPEEARRGVHAGQDSLFHRAARPGDELITTGRIVSARAVRAGVLVMVKLQTIEADGGAPVTTSWSSSIYRDVALSGDARTLEVPPDPPARATAAIDAQVEEAIIPIPRVSPHVYSECANIWNPIHTERAVALAAGLPDIILHGTATWALAGLEIVRRYCRGDVRRLGRFSGRFTGMVLPGDTLVMRTRRTPDAVFFNVREAHHDRSVCDGFAII